jgi:DNA-binding CsgD family transcriptional regulator
MGTSTLGAAAAELYGDLRLAPLLRQLLTHSSRLLQGVAGSVSIVDPGRQRYAKMAESGASCRLGQSFPLDEGATGQVVRRRRPVLLDSYRQIAAGHLPAGDPASSGAVVAVPIWWRGEVIGANVAFAGRRRRFTVAEVDDLEALTQLAAPGIVASGGAGVVPGHRDGPPFTPREREVLGLLAAGASDREVAAALVISPKTVEKHVAAVLRKSGAPSRTAAVVRGLGEGWLGER